MAEFLLELYVPRGDAAGAERDAAAARLAADELRREGSAVRYVRSIFMPEDETCLLLYEASSAAEVRRAAELASLPAERIVEAATITERGAAS